MAPTRETETIFDGRYNARLSPKPSAAQAFPLCPACRNHRKRLPDDIPALCILPIFGVMLLTVIMGGSDRNVIARLILFFVSWRLACLFQFKRTVQTAHIREGHAGFWESVRILHADTAGEGVLFGFTNKEYAALFAEKNGGKVTQELLAKSMKVREFLDASPTFRKRFILCRTIATAAALPLLLLFP